MTGWDILLAVSTNTLILCLAGRAWFKMVDDTFGEVIKETIRDYKQKAEILRMERDVFKEGQDDLRDYCLELSAAVGTGDIRAVRLVADNFRIVHEQNIERLRHSRAVMEAIVRQSPAAPAAMGAGGEGAAR